MDKIQSIAEESMKLIDRSRRLQAVIVISAATWTAWAVLFVGQMFITSNKPAEEPKTETPVVVENNCADVTKAASVVVETFTQFLDTMNDNNAVLGSVGQRAAARGLVNQSDTNRLRVNNDRLEQLNGELQAVLAQFEREAARCYAQQ